MANSPTRRPPSPGSVFVCRASGVVRCVFCFGPSQAAGDSHSDVCAFFERKLAGEGKYASLLAFLAKQTEIDGDAFADNRASAADLVDLFEGMSPPLKKFQAKTLLRKLFGNSGTVALGVCASIPAAAFYCKARTMAL